MKKFVSVVLVAALLAAVLTGCGGNDQMTAEETVQKFFDYWNEKNEAGMRGLMYEKMPQGDWQLGLLNTVTLDSCVERQDIDKTHWTSSWYPNPYEFTYLEATFTVDAKEGHVLPSGTHAYNFWLVKESKNSDWIIVSFGMG